MSARYATIEAFYADRGGTWSGERDFGVMWTDSNGRRRGWPLHRVSVVRDTGDVYAVALAGERAGSVELLGNVGALDVYEKTERLLDGWANTVCDLDWARERLLLARRDGARGAGQ